MDSAASNGRLEATRWLLDPEAVLNLTVDGHVRCCLLTGASFLGHFDTVKLLIERGTDVNAGWAGKTALDHAAEHGERAVYDVIYSVGGRYAEELTVRKSIAEAVRLGESVGLANLPDDHPEEFRLNNEPCIWHGRATYCGSVACLERLAERGADVNDPVGVGGPLATAAGSRPVLFVHNVLGAVGDGFAQFFDHLDTTFPAKLFEWLTGNLVDIPAPASFAAADLGPWLLDFFDLYWAGVEAILVQAVGQGNIAVLTDL